MNPDNIDIPRPGVWFGYFYGHDLDFLAAEALVITRIPPALLKKEAALMKTKWFDYRRMHPAKATYLLAHLYDRAFRVSNQIMKDKVVGTYQRGFKGTDYLLTKEVKSFWRLRQLIDSLGIRYDFYLRHGMDWCIANGWLQPPRPCHLCTNEEMIADIMLAWETEKENSIQVCKDTRYNIKNFFGHSDQIAYEDFVVEQIKTRTHPKFALSAALYTNNIIRIETAIREFTPRVVEDAIDFAK